MQGSVSPHRIYDRVSINTCDILTPLLSGDVRKKSGGKRCRRRECGNRADLRSARQRLRRLQSRRDGQRILGLIVIAA